MNSKPIFVQYYVIEKKIMHSSASIRDVYTIYYTIFYRPIYVPASIRASKKALPSKIRLSEDCVGH